MRFFGHLIEEYSCTERCGYHFSISSPNFSKFHMMTAIIATVPFWLISLKEPWHFPWYYLFCILAGEIVLLFLSGFLLSFFCVMPLVAIRTKRCKECGAIMFSAGRHFDPKGSRYPNWNDFAIFFVFIGINIAVWLIFVSGYFVDVAISTGSL